MTAANNKAGFTASGRHILRRHDDVGYSRTVSYNSRNHASLIFQQWGSINRKILPILLINMLVAIGILALLGYGIDVTISEFGHEFMSVLLAFLVINKLQFTIELYYEVHGMICKMNQALVEITQLACSFTRKNSGAVYQQWRFNVAYQALILNRVTSAMVYQGGSLELWKMAQFDDDPLLLTLPNDDDNTQDDTEGGEGEAVAAGAAMPNPSASESASNKTIGEKEDNIQHGATRKHLELPKEMYIMGLDLKSDLNLRVPIRVSQRLQETILRHDDLPQKLDPIQEMQLLNRIQDYMVGYREFRKVLTAPLPLPWVQLARIFVFAYVFTLPFALFDGELNMSTFQSFFILIIVTYGFIGCELLYIELDDPFGDDANDLPVVEEAMATSTDILLSLAHVDGVRAAQEMQRKIPHDEFAAAKFYGNKLAKNKVLLKKHPHPYHEKKSEAGTETDPLLKR